MKLLLTMVVLALSISLISCGPKGERDKVNPHASGTSENGAQQANANYQIQLENKSSELLKQEKKNRLEKLSKNLTKQDVISGCDNNISNCQNLSELKELPEKILNICEWIEQSKSDQEKWILFQVGFEIKGRQKGNCLFENYVKNQEAFKKLSNNKELLNKIDKLIYERKISFGSKLDNEKILNKDYPFNKNIFLDNENIKKVVQELDAINYSKELNLNKQEIDIQKITQLINILNGSDRNYYGVDAIEKWKNITGNEIANKTIIQYLKIAFILASRTTLNTINKFINEHNDTNYRLSGDIETAFQLLNQMDVKNSSIWSMYTFIANRFFIEFNLGVSAEKEKTQIEINNWIADLERKIIVTSEVPHIWILMYKYSEWKVNLSIKYFRFFSSKITTNDIDIGRIFKTIFKGYSYAFYSYIKHSRGNILKSDVAESISNLFSLDMLKTVGINEIEFVNTIAKDIIGANRLEELNNAVTEFSNLTNHDSGYNLLKTYIENIENSKSQTYAKYFENIIEDPFLYNNMFFVKLDNGFAIDCDKCQDNEVGYDIFNDKYYSSFVRDYISNDLDNQLDASFIVELFKQSKVENKNISVSVLEIAKKIRINFIKSLKKYTIEFADVRYKYIQLRLDLFNKYIDFQIQYFTKLFYLFDKFKNKKISQMELISYLNSYIHPLFLNDEKSLFTLSSNNINFNIKFIWSMYFSFLEKYFNTKIKVLDEKTFKKDAFYQNISNVNMSCDFKGSLKMDLQNCIEKTFYKPDSNDLILPWLSNVNKMSYTKNMSESLMLFHTLDLAGDGGMENNFNDPSNKDNTFSSDNLLEIYLKYLNLANMDQNIAKKMNVLKFITWDGASDLKNEIANYKHIYSDWKSKGLMDGLFDNYSNINSSTLVPFLSLSSDIEGPLNYYQLVESKPHLLDYNKKRNLIILQRMTYFYRLKNKVINDFILSSKKYKNRQFSLKVLNANDPNDASNFGTNFSIVSKKYEWEFGNQFYNLNASTHNFYKKYFSNIFTSVQ